MCIRDRLDLPKDTSRNPLFSVMLTTDDRDMTLPNLNGLKLSQKQQAVSYTHLTLPTMI
ncbi:hypothetical protein H8I08_18755, partial [Bacillus pumilus]|nr:hypothetical protein [Bacillus pumilus]